MKKPSKPFKPGELFNKFHAKKMKRNKSYSESDMGSMKGYDPNLGLGKGGMRAAMKPLPKMRGGKGSPIVKVFKKHKKMGVKHCKACGK